MLSRCQDYPYKKYIYHINNTVLLQCMTLKRTIIAINIDYRVGSIVLSGQSQHDKGECTAIYTGAPF